MGGKEVKLIYIVNAPSIFSAVVLDFPLENACCTTMILRVTKNMSEIWIIRVMYKIVGNHLAHFFKCDLKMLAFQLSSQKNKQPERL